MPTAADFRSDSEYYTRDAEGKSLNWGLDTVGAAEAYARLAARERRRAGAAGVHAANAATRTARSGDALVAPGAGVTVGLIDTGIEPRHWEFDSSRVTETILPKSDGTDGDDEDGSSFSHGTAVASLIAARRGGFVPSDLERFDFHGIAWGADLKMFAIPLGSGNPNDDYAPVTITQLTGYDPVMARRLDAALAAEHGVDVLNMSFSVQGLIENYDGDELEDALDDTIATAAQSGREDADKTLLVWAAANDQGHLCTAGTHNCKNVDEMSDEGDIDATSPAVLNALPVHVEALRSHSVSVVATWRDGSLASFSNRCGVAAQWCIAAPGADLLVAYYGPFPSSSPRAGEPGAFGYSKGSGTSYAAPLVAGGLAVLKHYFRDQLGNHEVLARLYETAEVTPDTVADGEQCPEHLDLDGDRSDCELSSTHGRGLMDLDAATRPVGSVAFVLGDTLSGGRVAAASSLLRSGGPAGNAVSAAFRGREVAVFDTLHAPFWVGLDGFTRPAAGPDLEDRLARFMRPEPRAREWGGFGVSQVPGVAGGRLDLPFASTRLRVGVNRMGEDDERPVGHASLVPVEDGGMSLTLGRGGFRASTFAAAPALRGDGWASSSGRAPAPPAGAGAQFAWRARDSALGLRFGALREFESSLGATGSGAFGKLASGVVFAGADFGAEAGGWRLEAGAELGVAGSEASRGLVREVSTVSTSAFSLSGQRTFDDGGRLRLSLSQPLRVESGRLRLDVPIGRTRRGEVVREAVDAPLSPSGRQLDLAADWRRPAGPEDGELRLGAVFSLQPGHTAGRTPDLALMAGYRLPF